MLVRSVRSKWLFVANPLSMIAFILAHLVCDDFKGISIVFGTGLRRGIAIRPSILIIFSGLRPDDS